MAASPNAPAYEAFGEFVRSQRALARLTLRQAAELARISNPYLSQIEHGVALPSITVLTALADALSVSLEMLLLRAAGVEPGANEGAVPRTEDAIRDDPRLTDAQRRALLTVLTSFTNSSDAPAPARRGQVPTKTTITIPPKTGTTTDVPKPRTSRKRATPHD
jgi:transcriptional regulator with XRE-family HTH domain